MGDTAEDERAAIVEWGRSFAKKIEADFDENLAKMPPWEREGARLIYDMGVKTVLLVVGGIEAGRHRA